MLEENVNRVHNLGKGVKHMSEDLTQSLPNEGVQLILSSLENLGGRMTALEDRMTALEDKVDRRLMETRPIWEQVLSRLDGIDARLDKVEERLDKIEARLDKIEGRLDKVEIRLNKVESEVYSLNRKFRVFYDDIPKIQDKQEEFEERLAKLEPESTQ
jgi:chromosome segregation ATPase